MKKYLLLMLPMVLVACTPHSDLRDWMKQEDQAAAKEAEGKKPKPVEPPVYKPYEPPEFSGLNAFDGTRLSLARNSDLGPNAPDLNRPKEILEGFGLDRVEYVGSWEKNGQRIGFVKIDGHVYTVRVGNHLGTDFGVVKEIRPNEIVLDETVQNSEGEWLHRSAEIPLVMK
ncbi:MAG: pilus assembly protein PilP [Neisseriaceae bacterium]|nr:pilus assembly protein PilP [Neisseriaceae bacterium]